VRPQNPVNDQASALLEGADGSFDLLVVDVGGFAGRSFGAGWDKVARGPQQSSDGTHGGTAVPEAIQRNGLV
jgi:hypothetical protein